MEERTRISTVPMSYQKHTIEYFKKYYRPSIHEDSSNKIGDLGQKVVILEDEKIENDRRFSLHKFNELASSKIPLLRKFPEKRRRSCFSRIYPETLPVASIIIIYHNEAESTLLRTVHTALSRSPYHLVKEVILVDDFSDHRNFPHLAGPLDKHFKNNSKIKIIRPKKRVGLIVARLLGARASTGDVLVFLDSHCETSEGWLEPLLLGVQNNPRSAITPIIEVIDMNDFSISSNRVDIISVGIFTWKGDFSWRTPENQNDSDSLIRSPTMAGGLFAINREFFFAVGSYDDKMTYWGGENLEISYRLWTCAEGIYCDPCSIVGHVFRENSPHDLSINAVRYNKLRTIEVWMDEYKNIVYNKIGQKGYDRKAGSVAERVFLRKKLSCKPFKWYLSNVASSLRIPGKSTSISNTHYNKCLDAADSKKNNFPVKLYPCHNQGGNQNFEVQRDGYIIFEDFCLDLAYFTPNSRPTLFNCHFSGGNQLWKFLDKGLIMHDSKAQLCLTVDDASEVLSVANCNSDDISQQFKFEFSN